MIIVRRLSADHDYTFGFGLASYAFGSEAVAQSVKTRLLFLKEDYFLDLDYGVPWLQEIEGVKPARLDLAEAYIKQTILETPGVEELISFSLSFDPETRTINISADVRDEFSQTFTVAQPVFTLGVAL